MKLNPELARQVEATGKVTTVNMAALAPAAPPARKSKYGNKKVSTPEGTFDSKKEYERWCLLKRRQAAGEIQGLRRQVPFKLEVNGVLICRYRADHTYIEAGRLVVEDVKGMRTDLYKLKRRLMKACRGIDIHEV